MTKRSPTSRSQACLKHFSKPKPAGASKHLREIMKELNVSSPTLVTPMIRHVKEMIGTQDFATQVLALVQKHSGQMHSPRSAQQWLKDSLKQLVHLQVTTTKLCTALKVKPSECVVRTVAACLRENQWYLSILAKVRTYLQIDPCTTLSALEADLTARVASSGAC